MLIVSDFCFQTNIVRYNEENLVKIDESAHDSVTSQLSNVFSNDTSIPTGREYGGPFSLSSKSKDMEMPMPPLTLAPLLYDNIRSCNASELLSDLVDALKPLAHTQQRIIQLCELPEYLEVAVEEPALGQALSNLIEGALLCTNVGGMVEIISTSAPDGGVLIIIGDDGPYMHYELTRNLYYLIEKIRCGNMGGLGNGSERVMVKMGNHSVGSGWVDPNTLSKSLKKFLDKQCVKDDY